MVAGDAVAALRGDRDAAKDVAAADDDADLDAHRPRLGDVGGDAVDDRDVDAEMLLAHQRLARSFRAGLGGIWALPSWDPRDCRAAGVRTPPRCRCGDAGLRYTKGAAMSRGALSVNLMKRLMLRHF